MNIAQIQHLPSILEAQGSNTYTANKQQKIKTNKPKNIRQERTSDCLK